MSLAKTKAHLIQLLHDPMNKVIALSGNWGTGKSHLWKEVQESMSDPQIKNSLYVSLFGLTTISQLKAKLLEPLIPGAQTHQNTFAAAKQVIKGAATAMEGLHKSFAAIKEVNLAFAMPFLRNKMFVIDDIERKHEKLSIDEIMGFIDEFTQQHGVRVLVILNSDKLSDKKIWDTFREKIVDQEIRLNTTPTEAFDIAEAKISTAYSAHVKSVVEKCKINNIRIILKIIRTVNRILPEHHELPRAVLERVIPSTVLLTATHYNGIENGPSIPFILSIGDAPIAHTHEYTTPIETLDEQAKERAKWRILIHSLPIIECDTYEHLVADFLASGLFDSSEIDTLLGQYSKDAENTERMNAAKTFFENMRWHPEMTTQELLIEATEISKSPHWMSSVTANQLQNLISKLPGGESISKQLRDNWIADLSLEKCEIFTSNEQLSSFHPDILAAIERIKTQESGAVALTLSDACKHLMENNWHSSRHTQALRNATTVDIETAIKELGSAELRQFLNLFLSLCLRSDENNAEYESAVSNFKNVCNKIQADTQAPEGLRRVIELFLSELNFKNTDSIPLPISTASQDNSQP